MRDFKGPLLLLICSIIWGSAFVAQSLGMDSLGPFSFNTARFLVGFITLLPIVLIRINKAKKTRSDFNKYVKTSILNGLTIGIFTGAASSFQQYGLLKASASKAGFLTALYIVLVPIIGLLFKRRIKRNAIFAVTLAMVGFYLLSVKGDFTIELSDIYLIICAVLYSFQIILIDIYDDYSDPIIMSQMQLVPSFFMSLILMLIFKEQPTIMDFKSAAVPILYAGVLSLGVAYTFQIIGQKYTEPTLATLIMSLESVFAAITGYLFQNDILTTRELMGCVIIFISVIICQIDFKRIKNILK